MKVTATTDKEVSDDEHLDLGEHRVTRETARDETGAPYEFYRCVDCGKEQVDRAAFTAEAVDADKCDECAELDGGPTSSCDVRRNVTR